MFGKSLKVQRTRCVEDTLTVVKIQGYSHFGENLRIEKKNIRFYNVPSCVKDLENGIYLTLIVA